MVLKTLAWADLVVLTEDDELYFFTLMRKYSSGMVIVNSPCYRCEVLETACKELHVSFHAVTSVDLNGWIREAKSLAQRRFVS